MRGSPGFIDGEFRLGFWATYRVFLPLLTFLFIARWLLVAFLEQRQVLIASYTDLAALGITAAIFYGVLAIIVLLFIAAFPTGVGPLGMRGYDGFGIYREIRWDEMTRVKYVRIAGIPLICCLRKGWIDMVSFMPTVSDRAAVQLLFHEYVPYNHPLRAVLHEHNLLSDSALKEQMAGFTR